MRIAYNPKTAAALSQAPANNDITFDLSGLSIYVRGVRFKGTDTTYSVFRKHDENGGGYDGLVPVPDYNNGLFNRFLREDGTWQSISGVTDINVYQSEDDTTDFRPVILGLTHSANLTELVDPVTGLVYVTAKIYACPNTGALYATKLFSGGKEVLTEHLSLADYVTLNTNLIITGVKTFSTLLKFTVEEGTSPFTVTSTTKVANLNADMLDGYHASTFLPIGSWNNGVTIEDWDKSTMYQFAAGKIMSVNGWSWKNSKYLTVGSYSIDSQRYSAIKYRTGNLNSTWEQSAFLFLPTDPGNHTIYAAQMRTESNTVVHTNVLRYEDYDTILASNVASATKLQTARTIWGLLFDGTANIETSVPATMPYVLFKNYNDNNLAGYIGRGSHNSNEIQLCGYSGNAIDIAANNKSGHIYINTSGNVGIGKKNISYKLDVNGVIAGNEIRVYNNNSAAALICEDLSASYSQGRRSMLILDPTSSGLNNIGLGGDYVSLEKWSAGNVEFLCNGPINMATTSMSIGYPWLGGQTTYKLGVRGTFAAQSGNFYKTKPSLGTMSNTCAIFGSKSDGNKTEHGLFIWHDMWSGASSLQSAYNDGTTSPLPLTLQPLGGNVGIGYDATSSANIPFYKLDVREAKTDWAFHVYNTDSSHHSSFYATQGVGCGMWCGISTTSSAYYIANFVKGTSGDGTGGSSALYIRADGNVGIGTTSPSYKLDVNGHTSIRGAIHNGGNYIIKPKADFRTSSATYTGAITITMPATLSYTMFSFWVDVYIYYTNTSFSVFVGGYLYDNNTLLHQPSSLVIGANHIVRFAYVNGRPTIYIGETNSGWSYPQISIRDVLCGFNNDNYNNWLNDWSIGFSTSFTNVQATLRDVALTSRNAYVSSGKGYINNTEITQVNNAGSATTATNIFTGYIGNLNTPSTWASEGYRLTYDVYDNSASNKPVGVNNANGVITLFKSKHGTSGLYTTLIAAPDNGRLYVRYSTSGSWASWATVAFTTDTMSYITVTNSDHNSTYRMVWHSGSTLFSTAGIYCNPYTDCIYASHYYESSDILLKENISSILGTDNIPILRKFNWKKDGKVGYGFIALELEALGYYELVDGSEDGTKTVHYTAALSLVVAKLQNKIEELEKEIEMLKYKN